MPHIFVAKLNHRKDEISSTIAKITKEMGNILDPNFEEQVDRLFI
jgi:hypothetical protein